MRNENEGGLFSCPVMCWIVGALLAAATYLILSGRFESGMVLSLALALGVFVVIGALLGRLFCSNVVVSTHSHTPRHDQDIATTPKAVVAVDSNSAMAPSVPGVARETTSADVAAKVSAPGTAPAVAPKAEVGEKAKAKIRAKATTKSKPRPKSRLKAPTKPAVKHIQKPAVKTETAPAPKPVAKPAAKPVAKDGKPEMLTKARAGGADDLKQIKGVGQKMETMLNEMGVYHFDQVSSWLAEEVKWVDENLKGFKGRVSRDEWVEQAKVLAKGGTTEFSKKVEKGGVYNKK